MRNDENYSTTDLHALLENRELLSALLSNPSTTHPNIPASENSASVFRSGFRFIGIKGRASSGQSGANRARWASTSARGIGACSALRTTNRPIARTSTPVARNPR